MRYCGIAKFWLGYLRRKKRFTKAAGKSIGKEFNQTKRLKGKLL